MAANQVSDAEPERSIRHVHAGLVSAAQFRDTLDELTARNVRPMCAALGLVFAGRALIYGLHPTMAGQAPLELYATVTAVAYGLIWLLTRRTPVTAGRANPIGFLIGVMAGANCVAGLFFGHPQQSGVLTVLAIVAMALFARSTALFALLVTSVCVGWFVTAALVLPFLAWRPQIVPIGTAVGVAVVVHVVFRRTERRLEETKAQLSLAASVDELTGLYNRRGFLMVGDQLIRQASQARVPVTLLFIDVDHLKVINDAHGLDTGDELLSRLGDVLRATFRDRDVLGRLGGDEFCVLMVGTQEHLAAERLRVALNAHNASTHAPRVTVSVAEVQYLGESTETLRTLIARGDAEMYAGKGPRRTA